MKKLMILLVLAALVPAGCGAPAADVVPQQTLQPASPNQEALTYQVETRSWEDAALAEDGTVLASYSFYLPEMTVLTEEGVRLETARTAEEETASSHSWKKPESHSATSTTYSSRTRTPTTCWASSGYCAWLHRPCKKAHTPASSTSTATTAP